MTVYIIGLAVSLAIAAIFLEFTFWIEKEVRSTQLWPGTQDFGGGRAARAQVGLTESAEGGGAVAQRRRATGSRHVAESAEVESPAGFMAGGRKVVGDSSSLTSDAYLSLVAPRPYDWKQK